MQRVLVAATCLLAIYAVPARAQAPSSGQAAVVTADQMRWIDAPQFGPGVKSATLAGDPAKDGPYVVRLKLPAGAVVPPHTHPGTENVTILAGTLGLGMGESFDKSKGKELPSGSFFTIPANMPHYAWASEESVIQVHGLGPSGITILEPASGTSVPGGK